MSKISIKDVADQHNLDINSLYRLIYNDKSIKTFGFSNNMIDDSEIERIVKLYEQSYPEDIKLRDEGKTVEERKREFEEKGIEEARQIIEEKKKMILSSCQSVDGYYAKEQLGLVFGECYFRSGILKTLSANLEDIVDANRLRATELSGSAKMVQNARDYAINKMKDEAYKRGANAIIGIDAESSIDEVFIHVTIYGTAVKLERL